MTFVNRTFADRKRRHAAVAVCAAGMVALTAGCTGSSAGGTASDSPVAGDSPSTPIAAAATAAVSDSAGSGATASAARSGSATSTGSTGSKRPTTSSSRPAPGNIHQTVPSRTVRTQTPVAPSAVAKFGGGVTVRATRLAAITATAQGPGEIGGPAVEIVLRFVNGSAHRVDLGNSVVTVTGDSGTPGLPISGSPARPVTGSLAPGRSAVGRYVFTLAKSERSPITINVSYAPSAPVVLIVGRVG